jgi:hypothetical protein
MCKKEKGYPCTFCKNTTKEWPFVCPDCWVKMANNKCPMCGNLLKDTYVYGLDVLWPEGKDDRSLRPGYPGFVIIEQGVEGVCYDIMCQCGVDSTAEG